MSARCCGGYQSSISLGCIDGTGSVKCLRRQLAAVKAELDELRVLLMECLDLSKAVDMSGAIRGPSLTARIIKELEAEHE